MQIKELIKAVCNKVVKTIKTLKVFLLEKIRKSSPNKSAGNNRVKTVGDMKIPRDTGKKVFRGILWGALMFLCVLGIWTVIKPDPAVTAKRLIEEWRAEQSQTINKEEVMNFTNDFLKLYYSSDIDGKEEYLSLLQRYASKEVLENPVFDFKSESKVNYANSYRIETVEESQVNVYATLSRTVTAINTEDSGLVRTEYEGSYTVKVPVYIEQGHYIVEDIPMMVADSGYKRVPGEYKEKKISQQEMTGTEGLKTQINNFLKAYYGDDQSVINQYLPEGASTMNFKAVSVEGSYNFENVDELKAYENEDGSITCLVSFRLRDEQTQTFLQQKFHMEVVQKESKVYIQSMDTKTINLK